MARANKRDEVLEAIVTIIEREGLTPVTLDAVAIETGMTRAGLLYHFPSREALIAATHRHLTELWERDLASSAGKSAADATDQERHEAYVRVCTNAARRVELLLMLESAEGGEVGNLWQQVIERWAPAVPNVEDERGIDRFIARLAADGLWINEALSSQPISEKLRDAIIARLLQLMSR